MIYSDQLNGYWEEGYHYYIEIRDGEMTVRNYRRKVNLKTHISYDAELLESGARTVISLENTVLSRDANGDPFTMIRELAYENGELKMLYYYTIMGETLYTLKKVDNGPFDHIIIRDEEYLDFLQGKWFMWSADGQPRDVLTVSGGEFVWGWSCKESIPFHVISYTYAPDKVRIVPADLTESEFPGFTAIDVLPDMLTTYMIVYDMNVPMTVFARADMLDKIKVPEAAKTTPRNTMTMPSMPLYKIQNLMPGVITSGKPGSGTDQDTSSETKKKAPKFCPSCGYALKDYHGKFCPNCGNRL